MDDVSDVINRAMACLARANSTLMHIDNTLSSVKTHRSERVSAWNDLWNDADTKTEPTRSGMRSPGFASAPCGDPENRHKLVAPSRADAIQIAHSESSVYTHVIPSTVVLERDHFNVGAEVEPGKSPASPSDTPPASQPSATAEPTQLQSPPKRKLRAPPAPPSMGPPPGMVSKTAVRSMGHQGRTDSVDDDTTDASLDETRDCNASHASVRAAADSDNVFLDEVRNAINSISKQLGGNPTNNAHSMLAEVRTNVSSSKVAKDFTEPSAPQWTIATSYKRVHSGGSAVGSDTGAEDRVSAFDLEDEAGDMDATQVPPTIRPRVLSSIEEEANNDETPTPKSPAFPMPAVGPKLHSSRNTSPVALTKRPQSVRMPALREVFMQYSTEISTGLRAVTESCWDSLLRDMSCITDDVHWLTAIELITSLHGHALFGKWAQTLHSTSTSSHRGALSPVADQDETGTHISSSVSTSGWSDITSISKMLGGSKPVTFAGRRGTNGAHVTTSLRNGNATTTPGSPRPVLTSYQSPSTGIKQSISPLTKRLLEPRNSTPRHTATITIPSHREDFPSMNSSEHITTRVCALTFERWLAATTEFAEKCSGMYGTMKHEPFDTSTALAYLVDALTRAKSRRGGL